MKKEDLSHFYSIQRARIFPVVVALSSLFLIIFVIYPQVIKLISNQEAMGNLSRRSQFLDTKVAALQSYDSEDLSYKLGIILVTLPPEKDFGNILGLLQQLTAKFGFITNSISFGSNADKAASISNFGVKLNIKGSKAMFQTLLDDFESSPRLIRVSSIEVSSKQGSQVFDSSLALEALYSQLPKDFGGIDSPLPELSQKDEELILRLKGLDQTVSTSSAVESPRGKSNPFE